MPKLRLSQLKQPGRDQSSRGAVLVIRPTKRSAPSDIQAEFNRLSWRISVLRRKIAAERERLTQLLNRFFSVVAPVEADLARSELELANALSAAYRRWPLRKQQTVDVRHLILRLLAGAFAVDDPDDDAIALHD
jgi:hypothetical protein